MYLASEPTTAHLQPQQLGVGIFRGAEAIVHAVHRNVTHHTASEDHLLAKVNLSNALNRVSRAAVLRAKDLVCPNWVLVSSPNLVLATYLMCPLAPHLDSTLTALVLIAPLHTFDSTLSEFLREEILGVAQFLISLQILLSSLPLSLGGLGMTPASDRFAFTFLSSHLDSIEL